VQTRDEFLDLPPFPVLSQTQKFLMVLGGEVRREQAQRCQVDCTLRQHLESSRELPGGPRGGDAPVGCVFGEVELLRAVGEEGGVPFGEVEAPRVEHGEVSDQGHRRSTLAVGQVLHLREEVLIGEPGH
jgi:hypothetical protein